MLDYSRYYRAYADMKQTLDGDFTKGYLTGAIADNDAGTDVLAGNAYNRVIDMDWVEKIEETLPYMDKAIREERRFIETYEEVDRVDKVKQVTKEAVRHLTQHTSLIQAVDRDGSVSPSKLLNTHREDSYATYENRFLYTLIFKTISFVEARFRALKEAPNDSSNKVEMNRDVTLNNQKFAFTLTYSVESHERDKIDREEDISKLTDYERISRIRMMLDDLVNTNLIQALKGCIQVRSPINKTNCIKKNPNFSKCNELWSFIESYRKTGYVIESKEFSGEMDSNIQSEIYDVMAFQHFVMTISTNEALRTKLHEEYVAENERRAREAQKPEEEQARWLEEQIYEARREEMAIRLKEVRERELIIAQLTNELEQEKEKVRQRDIKIKELQTLLTVREKELEETKEELRVALQRVAELEAELEICKARIAELEAIVEEQRKTIEAQAATIAALEAKIVELNALIDTLNAKIAELEAKVAELEAEVARCKAKIKELEEHIDFLNDKISVLETTVRDLKAEIEEHKARIAELEDLCAKQAKTIEEQASQIVMLNTSVAELRDANSALTDENTDLKSTVAKHEDTIATQAADIESKTSQIATLNNNVADLKSENSSLNNENDSLKATVVERDNTISTQAAEISDKNTKISTANSQIADLSTQLSSLQTDFKAMKSDCEAQKAKVAERDSMIEKNNSRSEKLKKELEKSRSEYSALNKTVSGHIAEIKTKNNEIAKHDKKVKKLSSDYEAKLNALKAEYERKLAEKDKEILAAQGFTDKQKYESRLKAETKAIQTQYNKDLKQARKKAKAFVSKAKLLIDYKPEKILELDNAEDFE